MLSKNS